MKAFINLFRRNWGLKLLALVLAVIVYYSMRDEMKNSAHPGTPHILKGPAS